MVHRKTLYELYQIVKEETDMFENCLYQTSTGLKKRSLTTSSSGCNIYRHTLMELFEIVKEEAAVYENCLANNTAKAQL